MVARDQQEAPLHHDGNYAVSTRPVTRENDHCNVDGGTELSSGGVLILREIEKRLALATVRSRHISDDRDGRRVRHSCKRRDAGAEPHTRCRVWYER